MNIANQSELDSISSMNHPFKQWYAVYSIVRHEKSANTKLTEKGIETFLPLREVTSRWKDRFKKVQIPLFPGYLFINIDSSLQDRFNILNTRGVVRIVADGDNPAPIPTDQINAIQTLLKSRFEFQNEQYDPNGKEATVIRGPLTGVRGKVIEQRGNYRLILSVDLIQQSIAAEVDIRDVQLV